MDVEAPPGEDHRDDATDAVPGERRHRRAIASFHRQAQHVAGLISDPGAFARGAPDQRTHGAPHRAGIGAHEPSAAVDADAAVLGADQHAVAGLAVPDRAHLARQRRRQPRGADPVLPEGRELVVIRVGDRAFGLIRSGHRALLPYSRRVVPRSPARRTLAVHRRFNHIPSSSAMIAGSVTGPSGSGEVEKRWVGGGVAVGLGGCEAARAEPLSGSPR